ncbi:molybdopterin synthase sulfur carrier subunit [Elizabethkingia miricola]|uniref:Molybdopterin synthase sulfur carrier subunit n=1 Tax=Elizabethkingia miricola TaxID=172045 RepID=A0ABD4DR42_ELIMR|nr:MULTISPECIES: MoaD/ThiS family protein [Elizabethkingia]KUY20958.1 molybdopterin synthase sulfur carrier subunit [Elizabethkingia miricola]MCL1654178.1 MoaD/ThiS family protein [Elizabethkingia miricola]OPC70691.1 molybdopterin synthase sulfur carrier subunit [Elizabethkingia miricola]OPC74699.1 molybdopterin synthase sulfur carrier subunit [Elizabethkingia miricola]QCO44886.1 MoaD/ThiS family protein [Elizabethkingia sp. 2-6]
MKLKILAFGIAKDILGAAEKDIDLVEGTTVQHLKLKLEDEYAELKHLKSYFIAVDDEYAENDQVIISTNEIAIIPPVSGG